MPLSPGHTLTEPPMDPGTAGAPVITVMARVAVVVLQAVVPVTEMLDVVDEPDHDVLMLEVPCPEVMVTPGGRTQA